jgi:hypothetical protein
MAVSTREIADRNRRQRARTTSWANDKHRERKVRVEMDEAVMHACVPEQAKGGLRGPNNAYILDMEEIIKALILP